MLRGLKGDVVFDIYGPLEDGDYWKKCQAIAGSLPRSVQVNYRGTIGHDEVAGVYSRYDLFLFPTHGENFGHVIIEALVAGCPILISDQTPWRGLQNLGVGWDLPLDRPERFTAVLQQCVDMGKDDMRALSQRARAYGLQNAADPEKVRQNRRLFTVALNYRTGASSHREGEVE
jgi:glycosyltransferase involved in cell wall biosynthesis